MKMNGRLPKKITRRAFLSTSAKLAFGIAGILLGSSGLFYYGAIQQKKREARMTRTSELPGNIVKIGEMEALKALQGFEKVAYSATIQDAWVTNSVQGFVYVTKSHTGELLILSPSCTHLGCTVEPATEAQRMKKKELFFLCPCHGAEFDKVGDAVGVVVQGLDTYKPITAGGNVYIDIALPIKRT
ncbi:hypothetical protein Back11_33950 [Paenibacillus baekrokdamisoli]|uniref:Uncharacterized protein n=1 Tax=Paenibacillus baekrokdamisoli TaxID=1712516 RepID=A0A3G9IT49_9BACL|nr:Rieske (2Fe-2S) protein [Paenibacillus baekrokdamisoli]MBB3073377.1 menaquinol-cytochrome c reductase iron-sulfur subunit [Paenibacillus baekrokdamisoli]BBH22050.1 hypothetical protein Back11_33950 [Paenibacillus baekrokdamisoli]